MFTNDSRTENFLTSIGVKYKYTNGIKIPEDLVPEWAKENIGRPVAVRDDAVVEYAALMEAGSAAPAPILYMTDTALRVLDGVQRLSAAELLGTTRVSAYVVTTDSDDLLAAIRVLANARMQGRAEPAEWTRRRAVEVLVVERKLSPAEVARMGGWKALDIKRIAEAVELQRRITGVGGPDLPDAMLTELRPHLQGPMLEKATQPAVGFLNTLKQARVSVADAAPYIEQFFDAIPQREKNPFKVYTERLDAIHEDPEIKSRLTGRQSVAIAKDVVLLKALKGAETTVDGILASGERVQNVDEFFRIIDRINRKLKSIAPNKAPQTARVPADLWSKDA